MDKSTKVKAALQKISSDQGNLSKEEAKALKGLVSILRRAQKGKKLTPEERSFVRDTIANAKAGIITLENAIILVRSIFHVGDLFKDYS